MAQCAVLSCCEFKGYCRPGGHYHQPSNPPDYLSRPPWKQTYAARGKGILDAAEKGLVKAAERFLRNDPKCMEAKDAESRETWALELGTCFNMGAAGLFRRSQGLSCLPMYAFSRRATFKALIVRVLRVPRFSVRPSPFPN